MSTKHDEPAGHTQNRRELIKKALALAPIYAAPAILVTERPVAAQISRSPCTGEMCGTYLHGCGGDQSCACATLADGSGTCHMNFQCNDSSCDLANPCPAGFHCVLNSCCGPGVCAPDSALCGAGAPPTAEDLGDGPTGFGSF